jgi:hypothetical protein
LGWAIDLSVYFGDGVKKKCLVNGFKDFESHDLKK